MTNKLNELGQIMNDKQYTINDIVYMDSIKTMENNIKKLGQKRTLEIINNGHLVLTDEQRANYKRLYFKTLHKMEG